MKDIGREHADTSEGPARARAVTFSRLRSLLLFVAVAGTACLMPAQSDTYWHLRAGQDLFRGGVVPLADWYSHTARGLPWPNHEWLWQAISYGLYRVGGMPLLVAVAAACATGAAALAYGLARARPAIDFLLALVAIPLASLVWALRPQVVSLLLLVLLVRAIARRRFWIMFPLFVVWANLHGAVALGGAALATATVLAWFYDRARFARWLLITVLCGVGTALTPMGVGLWRFIGESMARSRQNQIMEWLPSYPKGPIEIAFWLGALVLLGVTVRRWRRLTSWEDRVVVAVALMLLPLAARAVRNISPFFLLWLPAMSRLIGPDARLPRWRLRRDHDRERDRGHDDDSEEHPRLNLVIAAVGLVGAAIAVAWCWARPIERLGWHPVPAGAIRALTSCPSNLYNRYNEGGFLIWFVPTVPVFIDSRQDPYPAELLAAHGAAEQTGDYHALFARHQIQCAALPPASAVAKRLAADGWVETFRDHDWLVLRAAIAR